MPLFDEAEPLISQMRPTLELVLANDYERVGDRELARRSRVSAASCFWRAGEVGRAHSIFEEERLADPSGSREIQDLLNELKGE